MLLTLQEHMMESECNPNIYEPIAELHSIVAHLLLLPSTANVRLGPIPSVAQVRALAHDGVGSKDCVTAKKPGMER
jgi:hypothetical protein